MLGYLLFDLWARLRKPVFGDGSQPVLWIAHRGDHRLHPENSLAAITASAESKADMIEIDVHLSSDGIPVVFHDTDLLRLAGRDIGINQLTAQELREIHLKNSDQHIPTLQEVLQLDLGNKKLLIELKNPARGIYPDLADAVADLIMRLGVTNRVIVQSFEAFYLKRILENYSIECHQLIEGAAAPLWYDTRLRWGKFRPIKGVTSINVNFRHLNRQLIGAAKKHGINLMVYTPNTKSDATRSIRAGACGIITDNLELFR